MTEIFLPSDREMAFMIRYRREKTLPGTDKVKIP